MQVDCNIDSVINFLQKRKEEGYETVELIDDVRASGWFDLDQNKKLNFIFSKQEPKVLGIDARTKK